MTPLSSQARQPEQVERVDFAVPGGGTIGPRFPSWQEAVDHARAAIERFEYPGQQVREDAPGFHPRRYFQEGGTLVVYSRAFVHMRAVTTPVQDRPGGAAKHGRCDGVVCAWEVFRDGTVETCPEMRNARPEVPEHEKVAARQLESSGCKILDRGWESTGGRLDIVAADRTTLIVCQVRPRTTAAGISPAARGQLRRLAVAWMSAHETRFDQVRLDLALYCTDKGQCAIEHIYAIEHIAGAG
jgi:putative endonuclease